MLRSSARLTIDGSHAWITYGWEVKQLADPGQRCTVHKEKTEAFIVLDHCIIYIIQLRVCKLLPATVPVVRSRLAPAGAVAQCCSSAILLKPTWPSILWSEAGWFRAATCPAVGPVTLPNCTNHLKRNLVRSAPQNTRLVVSSNSFTVFRCSSSSGLVSIAILNHSLKQHLDKNTTRFSFPKLFRSQ